MRSVILLHGRPGSGKTTVIQKTVTLAQGHFAGFYTQELRIGSQRVGFELVTLDGRRDLLATKDPRPVFKSQARLGSYRVNLAALESLGIPAMLQAQASGRIVVIDEIGPMEISSARFCEAVRYILDDQGTRVLGAIVERPYHFADDVKRHPRVKLQLVTAQNRDALPVLLCQMFALCPEAPSPS